MRKRKHPKVYQNIFRPVPASITVRYYYYRRRSLTARPTCKGKMNMRIFISPARLNTAAITYDEVQDKVNPVNNDFCPYSIAKVFCQRDFMFFTTTPKGCASEIITQFGENLRSGKTNDFSALATDPKIWQDIELTVKNKKVSIRMNNKEVFSTTYQQSAGLITGLGFISNGLVQVDFVEVKTIDGKNITGMIFNERALP